MTNNISNTWHKPEYRMSERAIREYQKEGEDELLTAEEFLAQNYSLFAVMGVLAALAVYLRNFKSAASTDMVNLGIVSSLLMFIICSGVILSKLMHQTVGSENLDLNRFLPLSVLTIGVAGLSISILSITMVFRTELIQIADWGVGILVYVSYLVWYPWGSVETLENVSDSTRDKLKNVPGNALLIVVLCTLFFLDDFLSLYEGMIEISGYEKNLMFPAFAGLAVLHLVLSIVFEAYLIARDEENDWGNPL